MQKTFTIKTLGQCGFDNPRKHGAISDEYIPVYVSEEFMKACGAVSENDAATLYFQEAGPREKIFFEPEKTKVAIVT